MSFLASLLNEMFGDSEPLVLIRYRIFENYKLIEEDKRILN